MTKTNQNKTSPSSYSIFYAIGMAVTWFIILYFINEMNLESAIISSILTAIIVLILPRFRYLIEKKRKVVKLKNLILLFFIPSFGFLIGIVSILNFLVGFTVENTFMIALSSYALILLLIPVKTRETEKS